ncbi:MFS transporter [Streptomyces sp. NPDC056503]|uniref:MFS transporter n=1 Tax=Streptomyces sp. NPDC056503 TaxID=3345842 RepID=UPI0036BCC895
MAINEDRLLRSTPEIDSTHGVERRRAWPVLGLLLLLLVVNYADKAVVGLAGVEMKRDLGLSSSEFGLLTSVFFLPFVVGGVLGGALTRRFQARWLLFGIAVLWAVSLLPLTWQVGFGVVVASRVVLGFAEGPTTALAMYIAHSWFPAAKRALPSSVIVSGAALGPVIAAPALTWVITNHSWHMAFGALAAVGAFAAALWLFAGREGPEAVGGGHDASSARLPDRVPLRRVFGTGTVVGIMVLFFVAYANTSVKVGWLPLYLREGLGYSAGTAGTLVSLPYLGGAVAVILIGWISGRMTKRGMSNRVTRGVLGASLVLASGVATAAFAGMDAGPLQMVLLVLGSSLNAAGFGATFAAISDVSPAGQRGVVLGVITAFYSLAGVIAPLVMGHLVDVGADAADGYGSGFLLLGVVMIVGAVVALVLVDPDRDAAKLADAADR